MTEQDRKIPVTLGTTHTVEANNVPAENVYLKSCGESGDIIATCQRLIEAGVANEDPESIEAGRKRWKEVWPKDIVDLYVDLYIEDLKEELASGRPLQPIVEP